MNRDSNDTQKVKLTGEEIAKHVTKDDCWVIVHGKGKSSHRSMP
jgi:L-lactate dehydrogenase (cytochrome)